MPTMPVADPELYYQSAPILQVSDVPATAAFYRQVLGFGSDDGGTSEEYTVVHRDNAAVHLARQEPPTRGARIFFWVTDVDRVHEEVTAKGARVTMDLGTREYGVRDFAVEDPNGVTLVFGQDAY